MLKEADCGVAMSNRESFPNVAGCDFIVKNFRDLKRLMFVEGRHSLVYTVYDDHCPFHVSFFIVQKFVALFFNDECPLSLTGFFF
jgi:magnesium-transporting ATPase (P-type)